MKFKLTFLTTFLIAAFCLFSIPTVHAQAAASITGILTDTSGAVIPGASVILQNAQTGATYKTVTSDTGSYTINAVEPGPGYEIRFDHEGFEKVVVSGLYLNVSATRTQNAVLRVGNVTQTVSVSGSNQNVTLNTTDATIGNNFEVDMVNQLPVQIRDTPAALFTLQPGVTEDAGGERSVTGARTDSPTSRWMGWMWMIAVPASSAS